MKTIIMLFAILIANITLGQTKVVSVCDTSKKSASAKLGSIFLSLEVKKEKYTLHIFVPTDKPDVVIKNFTFFEITMQDDSTLIYFTKGNAVAEFNTSTKQYEYFLMLEGDYKDAQWQMLTKKRIKSIKNLTGTDFLIKPEDAKKFLVETRCYSTKFK